MVSKACANYFLQFMVLGYPTIANERGSISFGGEWSMHNIVLLQRQSTMELPIVVTQ